MNALPPIIDIDRTAQLPLENRKIYEPPILSLLYPGQRATQAQKYQNQVESSLLVGPS